MVLEIQISTKYREVTRVELGNVEPARRYGSANAIEGLTRNVYLNNRLHLYESSDIED